MFKNLKMVAAVIMCMLVLTSISLVGCGSSTSQGTSSSSGQQPSSSSTQQPSTSSDQKPSQSGQPGPGQGGQQPPGQMNNEEMLSKVAELLGISADELTSAFEEAQESVFAGQELSSGQPPSGEPSTGEQPTGEPPTGEPPNEGQGGPDMSALYDKMAEILGLSADDIASAFEQARQSLSDEQSSNE